MASNTSQLVQDVAKLYSERNLEGIFSLLSSAHAVGCNRNQSVPGPESDTLALRSLLWPVPRLMDLRTLAGFITSRDVGHIYSVGCGTGLLEYLLMETMLRPEDEGDGEFIQNYVPNKIPQLTGIEIDSKWWTSPYAPPTFIALLYVSETFPVEGPFGSPQDLVIFSYFNCMKVFVDYLNRFQGKYVIIIGPNRSCSNKKQYCAPSPLDLRDGDSDYEEEQEDQAMELDQLGEPQKKRRRSTTTVTCKIPTDQWSLVLYQRFGLEEVDNVAIYSRN